MHHLVMAACLSQCSEEGSTMNESRELHHRIMLHSPVYNFIFVYNIPVVKFICSGKRW